VVSRYFYRYAMNAFISFSSTPGRYNLQIETTSVIGERRFVVAKEIVDFIHNHFPLKHEPSANPEYAWMHGLVQRNQAVHFLRRFGNVDQGIIAAPDPLQELVASFRSFSKTAAEGSTSDEYDPMDFDNDVATSIAHLDASIHHIHKVNFVSLARSSCPSPPVSAPVASDDEDDGDNGDNKDLGLSDNQTADNVALRMSIKICANSNLLSTATCNT